MKKKILYTALFLAGALAASAETNTAVECDCPSCARKEKGGFTLPGLQGLEKENVETEGHHHAAADGQEEISAPHSQNHDGDGTPHQASHDDHSGHDHTSHEGHDHAAEGQVGKYVPHDHDGDGVPDHASHDDHDDHSGHDHGSHDGHDHGPVEGIKLTQEMFDKLGIQVHEAAGGTVEKMAVFPAEIKLNRDTTASISARYASIVKQVNAEIGDKVIKGQVLALLENRETMAIYKITAPHAGVIISKDLAVGEVVGDDKPLFEVADLSSVWADISVFPRYQHLLRKGMPVNFIARDGCMAHGNIKYISPIISHETRTFTARCILKDARDDFTPGAFVRASINIESVNASVVVPRQAVQTLDSESVVFVPSPNGFIPEVVSLGLADDQHIEITKGLNPGEKYAAVGAFSLKAQMITSGMDPHAGHGH